MADYIPREVAIAETRKPRLTDAELRRRLAQIPAADVQPVRHGRWVLKQHDGEIDIYNCSCCGLGIWHYPKVLPLSTYGYCPKCGAKMEG